MIIYSAYRNSRLFSTVDGRTGPQSAMAPSYDPASDGVPTHDEAPPAPVPTEPDQGAFALPQDAIPQGRSLPAIIDKFVEVVTERAPQVATASTIATLTNSPAAGATMLAAGTLGTIAEALGKGVTAGSKALGDVGALSNEIGIGAIRAP
jgi:hypothetical protein